MKQRRTRINGVLGYWSMFCEECGTTHKVIHSNEYNAMLCQKHYMQMRRGGKIFRNTRFDKNEYRISDCGKYAYISLYNKNSEQIAETIVDIENLEKCLEHRIHLN